MWGRASVKGVTGDGSRVTGQAPSPRHPVIPSPVNQRKGRPRRPPDSELKSERQCYALTFFSFATVLPGSFGAPPYFLMNASVSSRACESGTWTGGDFIR